MRILAFTFAVLVALGSAAAARPYSEEELREAETFAVGNVVWVLYHEIGHLLVDAFSLPVLGREEDAVDNLATVILLEERSAVKDEFLIAAVDAFFLMAERPGPNRTYAYHGHGFSNQRAFQVSCLMFGRDPVAFARFADIAGLPDERRRSCPHEYEKARSSWFTVLGPHRSSWWNGAQPVAVDYGPAPGPLEPIPQILRRAQVLEVAGAYLGNFALPRQYRLSARACNESNAFYEPRDGTVILCYELFDSFVRLLLDHLGKE